MARCPSIDELETLLERDDKKLVKHARSCVACQGLLAILVGRTGEIETPDCALTELLAARRQVAVLSESEASRVNEHTASCEACRYLWSGELP